MAIGRRLRQILQSAAMLALALSVPASAAEGPFAVTRGDYRFTDRSEPLVATDRKVDLWAEVYRPKDLGEKPFPLAVFLHGNHATCGHYDPQLEVRVDDRIDYTTTGTCPKGYVVVPSHLGYGYFAEELASWGYIVVSINADRGINAGAGVAGDAGLNLMRGRLILRHLALLSGWNRGTGPIPPPVTLGYNPVGTMNFAQVGLMGHSRGGEGARAALQQFRDGGSPFPALIPGLDIHSIFEIGPVDGQTSRVLDAKRVNSIILLPACDGDVSDLEGMHVFDRVFMMPPMMDEKLRFHGTAFVWGANHNSYNTQWQQSDSPGCVGTYPIFQQNGTSKPQQVTSREMVVPFFRATVGAKADGSLAALFDPTRGLPTEITDVTNIERGYLPAPLGPNVQLLETFSKPTGTSDQGVPTKAVGISVVHQEASYEHQQGTRVATVSWTADKATRYFQVNFPSGLDTSGDAAISFRTALRCFANICDHKASQKGEMTYQIALVDSNGQVSNLYSTAGHVRISRPIGDTQSNLHSTLYTVEIPLSAFRGVTKSQITGVRFVFEQKPVGTVDLTDLALLKTDPLLATDAAAVAATSEPSGVAPFSVAAATPAAAADGNAIEIVRPGSGNGPIASQAAVAGGSTVDIVLTSKRSFPVTDALPKLKVGTDMLRGGTIGVDGKSITFSVPSAQFDALAAGSNVSLSILASAPAWQFGALTK